MKLLILPTTSDTANNVRYALADDAISDPELLIRQVIARVAEGKPRFVWADVAAALSGAGFEIPEAAVVDRPWDELLDPCAGLNFTVQFPEDAEHEYAGVRGTATSMTTGTVVIELPDYTLLTPFDRPYKTGREGLDQIPLGPLLIPVEQFANPEHQKHAAVLLREVGFECNH